MRGGPMKLITSSIAARVIFAFAAVLVVVIALGVTSVIRLGVVNDGAVEIRTNWLVATRALGDYQFATMRFRQIEAAALLAETPEQVAKEVESLKKVGGDVQTAWAAYEA